MPENYLWEKDKSTITVTLSGFYQVEILIRYNLPFSLKRSLLLIFRLTVKQFFR